MKVLFLGTPGFPKGLAEVEKQLLIAKSLLLNNCSVKFICNKSYNYNSNFGYKGNFEGVIYFYSSLTSKRLSNKYLNRLIWILGWIIEKLCLLILDYDCVILNSRNYNEIIIDTYIIHLRKKHIFLTLVEDLRSLFERPSKNQLNNIVKFESKIWFKIDGAFPISRILLEQIKSINPKLPILKIPVLVDTTFAEINLGRRFNEDYFMFCGAVDYTNTINLIINSFLLADIKAKLLLVISGNKSKIEYYKTLIGDIGQDKILIESDITKNDLWDLYSNAYSLLIPLNFNKRDSARFPHKIGEYCASSGAIITSNWGEISEYFINRENAILVDSDNPIELSLAIKELFLNKELKLKISRGARLIAENEFDYKIYGPRIYNFMREICVNGKN